MHSEKKIASIDLSKHSDVNQDDVRIFFSVRYFLSFVKYVTSNMDKLLLRSQKLRHSMELFIWNTWLVTCTARSRQHKDLETSTANEKTSVRHIRANDSNKVFLFNFCDLVTVTKIVQCYISFYLHFCNQSWWAAEFSGTDGILYLSFLGFTTSRKLLPARRQTKKKKK